MNSSNNISSLNRVPGGLLDGSTEFFTVIEDNKQHAMVSTNGHIYDFEHAPVKNINILSNKYNSLTEKLKDMYELLSQKNKNHPLEQMTMCLYGALNTEPDIDLEGNLSEPEYVPCIYRGKCSFEGIGCKSIMVQEGIFLSKAETEVFKLVNLPDKEIADKLFLSVLTVQKHFKNIREKTQFANKIEMAIWATKKGII